MCACFKSLISTEQEKGGLWLLRPVPPQSRWDSQVADLGSAYKLAPQSPGLPQTVNFSARVSLLILRLREVSSLSVGNYIQFWRSHESDFHGITRFGSKICHRSVTCVTCDTRVAVRDTCKHYAYGRCDICTSVYSRHRHDYEDNWISICEDCLAHKPYLILYLH